MWALQETAKNTEVQASLFNYPGLMLLLYLSSRFLYLSSRFPVTWLNKMVYFPIFFVGKVVQFVLCEVCFFDPVGQGEV